MGSYIDVAKGKPSSKLGKDLELWGQHAPVSDPLPGRGK